MANSRVSDFILGFGNYYINQPNVIVTNNKEIKSQTSDIKFGG